MGHQQLARYRSRPQGREHSLLSSACIGRPAADALMTTVSELLSSLSNEPRKKKRDAVPKGREKGFGPRVLHACSTAPAAETCRCKSRLT